MNRFAQFVDVVAGLCGHPAPHELCLHVLVLHYLVFVGLLLYPDGGGVAADSDQLDYALSALGQFWRSLGGEG